MEPGFVCCWIEGIKCLKDNSAAQMEEQRVKKACEDIKAGSPSTKISLFVEADEVVLKKCLSLKADAVEIHTGEYARDFLDKKDVTSHLVKFNQGGSIIKAAGWGYHAGHGLTFDSLETLLQETQFEEYILAFASQKGKKWLTNQSIFQMIKN